MPRSRPRFSALLNFPGAEYGPLALRPLLRELLLPGERIVGWSGYRAEIPFHRAAIAFALAILPIGHVLAGFMARVEKGVAILTDRRILLLTHDGNGPRRDGAGVRLDAPLETVAVTAKAGLRELMLTSAGRRRPGGGAFPARAGTRLRGEPPPVEPGRRLARASLFILTLPDGRSLTVKVPYFSGNTASGRLREGLVLLAGGTLAEDQRES